MRGSWTKHLALVMVGIVSVSLMGCQNSETQGENHSQKHQASGDLLETTGGVRELPSFVQDFDPQVGQVYQIAAKNNELLKWIPCYCGCGDSVHHKNNLDCFIDKVKKNGQIVWDSHATQCGTCLEIASESVSLKEKGKSTLEIRRYIDKKYQDGFAKPTPTPMPAS